MISTAETLIGDGKIISAIIFALLTNGISVHAIKTSREQVYDVLA